MATIRCGSSNYNSNLPNNNNNNNNGNNNNNDFISSTSTRWLFAY